MLSTMLTSLLPRLTALALSSSSVVRVRTAREHASDRRPAAAQQHSTICQHSQPPTQYILRAGLTPLHSYAGVAFSAAQTVSLCWGANLLGSSLQVGSAVTAPGALATHAKRSIRGFMVLYIAYSTPFPQRSRAPTTQLTPDEGRPNETAATTLCLSELYKFLPTWEENIAPLPLSLLFLPLERAGRGVESTRKAKERKEEESDAQRARLGRIEW